MMTRNESSLLAGVVGFLVGLIFFLVLINIMGGREYDGYCNAYEDLKKGKIEEIIKKRNPALWIKYNIPEVKKDVSQ